MSDRTEIDRALIGTSADPFAVEVEKGAIRRFAEAIGESAEIYFDELFAQSLGYPGIVAPPTFPTTFRPPAKPVWVRGLDEGRILAGEQGFRYWRPILAGERLHCELRFTDLQNKRGSNGTMELIIQDLLVRSPAGDMVCVNRRVVIYRGQTASLAQREAS
jgi:N-terminal half of MaoC dehydratase